MADQLETLLLTPCEAVSAASVTSPFDAVVVGGGPTGLTSARTLAEGGYRVAVIEAGPLVLLTHALSTDLRLNGGSVRTLQRALSYSPELAAGGTFGALVACVGGRGVFWNGAAPRYLESDFQAWPFTYEELKPYYAWAERDLFVSTHWGETKLAAAVGRLLRLAGIDAQPEPFAIDSRPSVNGWLSGTIGNPLTPLLRSGLLAPNIERRLSLSANAFALRLQRPQSTGHVEVVVKNLASGRDYTIVTRSVVLASGGFESVRLAISSKLPDLSQRMGRRLMDHWFVRGYFPLPPELYDATGPEAAALLVRPREEQPFQIEVHLPGRLFFQAHANLDWQPAQTEAYSAMVRAFAPTRSKDTTSYLEVGPGDAKGGYTVHIDTTEADLQLRASMVIGLQRIRDALHASDAQIEQYPLGASYHEAGGLQMATDERSGVVDPFGRLFGDPRVVVADASAWPSIGCANPHLTLVAIARRQALRLAQDLKV